MPQWVLKGKLARSSRPGYSGERGVQVPAEEVDMWLGEIRRLGIRSIICLLGPDQLPLYSALGVPLPEYYSSMCFQVEHIPVHDHQSPTLSGAELARVWKAFQQLSKPVLVHCSAGIDRTGAAVDHIQQCLDRAAEE